MKTSPSIIDPGGISVEFDFVFHPTGTHSYNWKHLSKCEGLYVTQAIVRKKPIAMNEFCL